MVAHEDFDAESEGGDNGVSELYKEEGNYGRDSGGGAVDSQGTPAYCKHV